MPFSKGDTIEGIAPPFAWLKQKLSEGVPDVSVEDLAISDGSVQDKRILVATGSDDNRSATIDESVNLPDETVDFWIIRVSYQHQSPTSGTLFLDVNNTGSDAAWSGDTVNGGGLFSSFSANRAHLVTDGNQRKASAVFRLLARDNPASGGASGGNAVQIGLDGHAGVGSGNSVLWNGRSNDITPEEISSIQFTSDQNATLVYAIYAERYPE